MKFAGWMAAVAAGVATGAAVCWLILTHDAPPPPPEPPPAPPVIYRYKQPSASPNFGKGFDYAGALSGAVAELPGSQKARAGILVDLDTHQVLWEQDSRAAHPIASLTKLLTIFVVMEQLEKADRPNFDSLVTVSIESTRANPVKVNLRPGEKLKLRDVITAMMIMSANDAAHQVAEYFGDGSACNFVAMMNDKAAGIGMTSSHFVNPNGLPIYGKSREDVQMNLASPLDMVILADQASVYPQIKEWTGRRQVDYRPGNAAHRVMNNTNRLLGSVPGADGVKTGYTDAARHCLMFSAERNGRRLVGVALGFEARDDVFDFSRRALEWGFKRIGAAPETGNP